VSGSEVKRKIFREGAGQVLRERSELPDGLKCRSRFTASSLGLNGAGERSPDNRLRDSSAVAHRAKAEAIHRATRRDGSGLLLRAVAKRSIRVHSSISLVHCHRNSHRNFRSCDESWAKQNEDV
jgi:hypothetical protein